MHKKRGVSPVIATVLLVLMTIVIAALIFMWARGFVKEQVEKFGKTAQQVCDELEFDVQLAHVSADLYELYIANTGNVPISAVDIKKIGTGKSIVDRRDISLPAGEAKKENINLIGTFRKVIVIPVLLGTVRGTGSQKAYTCPEQYGKQLNVEL